MVELVGSGAKFRFEAALMRGGIKVDSGSIPFLFEFKLENTSLKLIPSVIAHKRAHIDYN
jgi:hypothetical protein